MGHSADVAACVLMDDRRIRGRRPAHRRHERLVAMLFHVSWDFVDASEEGTARSLKVVAGWQPPAGADFKGFFGRADGSGGVALIEADRCHAESHHGALDSLASFHDHADPPYRGVKCDRRRGGRLPRVDRLTRGFAALSVR